MTDHDRHDHHDPTIPRDDAADARLLTLLHAARDRYNVPPATPPFDAMWERIEHDAFAAPRTGDGARRSAGGSFRGAPARRPHAFRNYGAWAGLAAGLLIGVLAGRQMVRPPAPPALTADAAPAGMDRSPVDNETARYLGQTAALLVALPAEPRGTVTDAQFTERAQQLLATTRLLLDDEAAPETRALLEDLELVLAQIVGIRAGDRREEMELINQALEQRELLPRLQSAVASSASAE